MENVFQRRLILFLSLVLVVICARYVALADARPFPEDVNTDVEIAFPGFEWYSDYSAVISAAGERGFQEQQDHFDPESIEETPHWKYIFGWTPNISGAEKGCGGKIVFRGVPNVAGYETWSSTLYMMWDPERGAAENYRDAGALQLYMAQYVFRPADPKGCYEDLVTKLKAIYGDNPTQTKWGGEDGIDYTYWLNGKGGMLVAMYEGKRIILLYCAPGSDEKLVQVEEKVAQTEIENAVGQTDGL